MKVRWIHGSYEQGQMSAACHHMPHGLSLIYDLEHHKSIVSIVVRWAPSEYVLYYCGQVVQFFDMLKQKAYIAIPLISQCHVRYRLKEPVP